MERSLIVIISIFVIVTINCGEDTFDGRLETRRGDDGRELIYEGDENWVVWIHGISLSPDATEVVFNVRFEGNDFEGLVILDLYLMETRTLLEENAWNARWSPSGEWIAYGTFEGPGTLYNVYLIRPDGSEKRPAVVDLSDDSPSDWLSDGNELLYGTTLINYSSNLAVYDLSTETKTMVTDFDDRNYSRMPAVSADDEWIAGSQMPKGDWYKWAL